MNKNIQYENIYKNNISSWNHDWNLFLKDSLKLIKTKKINNIIDSGRTNLEYDNIFFKHIINFSFKNYLIYILIFSCLFTFKYHWFSLFYFIMNISLFIFIVPIIYIIAYLITYLSYELYIKKQSDNSLYILTNDNLHFLNKIDNNINLITVKIDDIEKYDILKQDNLFYYIIDLKDKNKKTIISANEKKDLNLFLNQILKEECEEKIIYKSIIV